MTIQVHDDGTTLTFSLADGGDLATYVYRPTDVPYESPRPYFHPLRTPGGREISAYRPWDHVWHKGLVWSLPYVGPYNFWGGPTYVRAEAGYRDLGNDGSMDHESFAGPSPEGGAFTEELAWRTPPSDGEPGTVVVREKRTVSAAVVQDDAWLLIWDTELTNVSDGALDIGSPTTNGRENAGYGGLFWRGPRSFTGGTVLAPGFAGDAEEVRGERFDWMGFVGRHDGAAPTAEGGAASSTVVMVDPGTNPGGTPQWFVRSVPFACICPAPFFSEEVPFPAGETLRFRYAVLVADGESDPERGAALAELGRTALGAE